MFLFLRLTGCAGLTCNSGLEGVRSGRKGYGSQVDCHSEALVLTQAVPSPFPRDTGQPWGVLVVTAGKEECTWLLAGGGQGRC